MANGYALRWHDRHILSVTTATPGNQADLYAHSVGARQTHLHLYDPHRGSNLTIGVSLKDRGDHPEPAFEAEVSGTDVVGRLHLDWDPEIVGVRTALSAVGPFSTVTAASESLRSQSKSVRDTRELPMSDRSTLHLDLFVVGTDYVPSDVETVLEFGGSVSWGLLFRPSASSEV